MRHMRLKLRDVLLLGLGLTGLQAQTMYVMNAGVIVGKFNENAQVESMIFYKPSIDSSTTVTDIDGNVYNTITIGKQQWMAENLKTTRYADGTAIPLVNNMTDWGALNATDKAYCWYNYNEANKGTYGALYTWAAAINRASSSTANPSNIQGVCPIGWHLPCDAEWTTLTTYLGGESVASGKLKETSTTHWMSPNTAATNETGFTALPGGNCGSYGTFDDVGFSGYWWCATEYNSNYAWYQSMQYSDSEVFKNAYVKEVGFSVRCVRN